MNSKKYKYYLINKPYGVISQFSKEGNHTTLKEVFSVEEDVYPVGRLDTDSEGLLLLTNDRSINQKVLNPNAKKTKTYWVQVDGQVTKDALHKLEKGGLELSHKGKKYFTKPASAKEIHPSIEERNPPIRYRKNIPTSWVEITITEGKNRQVRKMTAAVGYPTLRLIRVGINKATLNMLKDDLILEMNKATVDRLIVN